MYTLPRRAHVGFSGQKPTRAIIDPYSDYAQDLAGAYLLHDYNDISGNGYTAQPSDLIPIARYHEKHKTGRIFNADEHINLGKPLSSSGPFSYLIVFRNEIQDFSSNNVLVGYGDRGTFRQYNNTLQFFTYNGAGWDSFTASNTYSQYDYIVAMAVHDGSNNHIYYNGTQTSSSCSPRSYGTHLDLWLAGEAENTSRLYTGDLYYAAIWNRALSPTEADYVTANPYGFLAPEKPRFYLIPSAGGGATVINVDDGALSIAGQTATATTDAQPSPGEGAISIAGDTVTLSVGASVQPSVDTFSIAGQDLVSQTNALPSPVAGSVTIAGQDVTVQGDKAVVPAEATLSISGQDVTLDLTILADAGGLSFTGGSVSISTAGNVSISPGSTTIAVSGQSVSAVTNALVGVTEATLSVSGNGVTLDQEALVAPGVATLNINGQSVDVTAIFVVSGNEGNVTRVIVDGIVTDIATAGDLNVLQ